MGIIPANYFLWTADFAGACLVLLLYAWGMNYNGQLGDNTTTNRYTPTQIGTSDWSSIAAGSFYSLGILTEPISSSNFFLFFN